MKKYIFSLVVLVLLLVGVVAVKAATTNSVKGWAWSSNIGWLSFNSTDGNTGTGGSGTSPTSYGVTVNENGSFSGYAWSSNVGWVSFNSTHISECAGATPATVSTSTGQVNGWVRVMSGVGRTDGWDGCVKLSEGTTGTVFPTKKSGVIDGTRGVMYDSISKKFKGYGWGSDVLGWVKFDPTLDYDLNVGCVGDGCGNGGGGSFSISCVPSPSTVNIAGGPGVVNYELFTSNGTISNVSWDGVPSENYDNNSAEVVYSSPGTYNQYVEYYLDSEPAPRYLTCPTVTVTNGTVQPPPTACVQPQNSTQCDGYVDVPSRILWSTENQCNTSPTRCEFYCNEGFEVRGGQCVKATIEES